MHWGGQTLLVHEIDLILHYKRRYIHKTSTSSQTILFILVVLFESEQNKLLIHLNVVSSVRVCMCGCVHVGCTCVCVWFVFAPELLYMYSSQYTCKQCHISINACPLKTKHCKVVNQHCANFPCKIHLFS